MEVVIKISSLFHNCAFHTVIPYLSAFLSKTTPSTKATDFAFNEVILSKADKIAFKQTAGYRYLLDAFANYYKLEKNDELEKTISELLEKHSHPLDQQVLLGPVLRLVLKQVLLNHAEHKNGAKVSFQTLLTTCLNSYRENRYQFDLRSKENRASWLSQFKWEHNKEHEELFRPNIELIASILESTEANLTNENWDKAYQNYCDYQCDPEKCVYVSEAQLNLLCESFNFKFNNSNFIQNNPSSDNASNPSSQSQNLVEQSLPRPTPSPTTPESTPLATITVINKSRNHWEIVSTKESRWDYLDDPVHSPAVFRRYHDIGMDLLSQDLGSNQMRLLQDIFRDKLHQWIIDKTEFTEEFYSVMPSDNWEQNGGLEGLVELIVLAVTSNQESFIATSGFQTFLQAFRSYYSLQADLSTAQILSALKNLFTTYLLPQEQFRIITPVLRNILKPTQTSQQLFSIESLLQLHNAFKVALELYPSREPHRVSCFDKILLQNQGEAFLYTVALTTLEKGWQPIDKDALKALVLKATTAYSPNMAFKSADAKTVQAGVSDYLKNNRLYVHTERSITVLPENTAAQLATIHTLAVNGSREALKTEIEKTPGNISLTSRIKITLNGSLDLSCQGWSPLLFAIYFGKVENVAQLLISGANWRDKGRWEIKDKRAVTFEKRLTNNVNALTLAACLDNRQLVTLILQYATPGADDVLVQAAYDEACNFKRVNALYPFLNYPKIKQSHHHVSNACDNKDLSFLQILHDRGTLIYPTSKMDIYLLADTLKWMATDPDYALALQSLLLKMTYEYRLNKLKLVEDTFVLSNEALKIIDSALDKNASYWLHSLIQHFETLPDLFKEGKKIRPFLLSNVEKILEIVAQRACKAIARREETKLRECLIVDERCLLFPGKDNPLHFAYNHNAYDFVENTFVQHLVQAYEKKSREPLTAEALASLVERAHAHFRLFSDKAYDRFARTLEFRMQRDQTKKQLEKGLSQAKTFKESFKYRASMTLFALETGRIFAADRIFDQVNHSSKIKNNRLYFWGSKLMAVLRPIHLLSTEGPIRYLMSGGFNLAYTYLPGAITSPISYLATRASSYVASYVTVNRYTSNFYMPLFVGNAVTFALMPQYYVVSTALGGVTYLVLNNSGYENLEAIAHLATDALAYNWTIGTGQNNTLDNRYKYRLTRNLTPIIGEHLTPWVVPAIYYWELGTNYLNVGINRPRDWISPTPLLGTMSIDFGETVTSLYQEWGVANKRLGDFIEHSALSQLADSAFKKERLHALQVSHSSHLAYYQAQLQKQVEQGAGEAVKQALRTQTALLETSKKDEERLFQQTEGYSYFQDWQKKLTALKYAEVDKQTTPKKVATLREESNKALAKSIFYNPELVNQNGELWAQFINELFEKKEPNFVDWNNYVTILENIVTDTFYISADRNQMAAHCANEIIRLKYPLYPEVGDKVAIEAERQNHIHIISTYKLERHHRRPERAKDRLYDYLDAIFSGTPEKRHVHRWERVVKPLINTFAHHYIGWIPFKKFKCWDTAAPGNISVQTTHTFGGSTKVDLWIADTPVHRVFDSAPKGKMELVLPENLGVTVRHNPTSIVVAPQPLQSLETVSLDNPAMSIDNPYIQRIVEEMTDELMPKDSQVVPNTAKEPTKKQEQKSTPPAQKEKMTAQASAQAYPNKTMQHHDSSLEEHSIHEEMHSDASQEKEPPTKPVNPGLGKKAMKLIFEDGLNKIIPAANANPLIIPAAAAAARQSVVFLAKRAATRAAAGAASECLIADKLVELAIVKSAIDEIGPNAERGYIYPIHKDDNPGYKDGNVEEEQRPLTIPFPALPAARENRTETLTQQSDLVGSLFGVYKKKGNLVGENRPYAPDIDKRYHPAPKELPGFLDAKKSQGKTPFAAGIRKRWVLEDKRILEWDYQHGEIEMYDSKGKHLGAYDPFTGEKLKEAKDDRSIKKYL